ncbi:caspase family protein [Haliangium sp.]|uniref:caspase family protein n=1 Tax=Haliangium sp. TaxID=2663208 RepID=UPI003D123394
MKTMSSLSFATLALVTLAAVAPPAQAASPATELRRFAVIIGANDGGPDRVRLRYAVTDARAVAQVARELGGVAEADVTLLLDPGADTLEAGFAAMRQRVRAAQGSGVRTELLVYYSGHSDEDGLLLGGARYSYDALRHSIRTVPADVHIAILDSCASGAFTRTKGGVRRPAFLVDQANQVRGHAFLSSSSASEAAQESDRIQASFFTHYLVSGLRGGADSNRDGRVTLREAYQFAFDETVARTERTRYGAQHPAYDLHLAGTGDVVMTDLRATGASLILAEDITGRLYIRDQRGTLVLELQKTAGAPVLLGLGPARYEITVENGKQRFRATVALDRQRQVTLGAEQLHPIAGEATVARGDTDGDAAPAADIDYSPFTISMLPSLDGKRPGDSAHLAINVIGGRGVALRGLELGSVLNLRTGPVEGVQVSGVANVNQAVTTGVQLAGAVNVNGADTRGIQVAGAANWNGGSMRGPQVAGALNVNRGDAHYVQVAGAANWNNGAMYGLQIAGAVNVNRGAVRGGQLSVINIGNDVDGVQLGVVNIARHVRGVQLGLVNIADTHDGVPIGLVSAVRDGYHSFEAWTSDLAPVNVGVKLGSRRFYSMLMAGADQDGLLVGLAFGVHLPVAGYHLDIDAGAYETLDSERDWESDSTLLTRARAAVKIPLGVGLSAFGGVSMDAAIALDGAPVDDPSLFKSRRIERGRVSLRLLPGLFAGLAY